MAHYDARDLNLNIDKKQLKALYKTKPYLHLGAILFDWTIILSVTILCIHYFHPLLYLAAVIIIGARMHALAILMHDATHYRFLKKRKLNDLITNVTSMYPLFSSIENYRQNHLSHHQHLNTEDDPDWMAKLGKSAFRFPQSKQEFITRVLSYFLIYPGVLDAIWFLKRFGNKSQVKKKKSTKPLQRLAYYLILIAVLTYFQLWTAYLMYWVVPYLTTFFMFQYIRSVAEHFGDLEYDHLLNATRSVKPHGLEKFLLAPYQVHYHIEHHLYPAVPFYNLPKLHKLLMDDPSFREQAHFTQGYFPGMLKELG